MALPSMTRSTGASNCFANSAVLPISFTGELPSNRPIIPSIMERSASASGSRKDVAIDGLSQTSSHPNCETDAQSPRYGDQDR